MGAALSMSKMYSTQQEMGDTRRTTDRCLINAEHRPLLCAFAVLALITVGYLVVVLGSASQQQSRLPPHPLAAGPTRVGAPGWVALTEAAACALPLPSSSHSSLHDPEPPVRPAAPGKRVRRPPVSGLPFQLFLPADWSPEQRWPVLVFLHGAGDGKFAVMNSQSLPRLLARNQSTSFDPRECWCLPERYAGAAAMVEANSSSPEPFEPSEERTASPRAACGFADSFRGIAVMPQGWLPDKPTGWAGLEARVVGLVQHVMAKYSGDPERVFLMGQSAGGLGAWQFALRLPQLWSAVAVICAPWARPSDSRAMAKIEGLPVWVVGWTGDGTAGNDRLVTRLRQRGGGSLTRYTRYIKAPGPPDPAFREMSGHGSYDLIARDPLFWDWAWEQRNSKGTRAWASSAPTVRTD